MPSLEKSDLEATSLPSFLNPTLNTTTVLKYIPLLQRLRFQIDAQIVSDAILGLSDGMTVPFALAAGLSAFGTTRIVIVGGLAELIAGAISMGLGGYLGARSIS